MNYETAKEIEVRIAKWFGIRKYVIVPNVSWGFLPYEADMIILTSSSYVWEVEIKVSRGDLLRDRKKRHQHDGRMIRQVWFAIPEKLSHCIEHVPEKSGVFVVSKTGIVTQVRRPSVNQYALKLSEEQRFKVARLGALRVWSLKEKISKLAEANQTLAAELRSERDRASSVYQD